MATYRLTNAEQAELRRLLEQAFDGPEEFDEFLQYRVGERVHSIAGPTDSYPRMLTRVIRRATAGLWWARLVVEARHAVPQDGDLLAFAARLGLGPVVVADGRGLDDAAGLEAKVKQSGSTFDVRAWRSRLGTVEGRVCRIDAGDQCGTGFLVGPDVVLTNHHVIDGVPGGDVALHFDYHRSPDGLTVPPPTTHRLAADWRIDASPGSRYDDDPDPVAEPRPDELDFALLRVAGRPGDEPVGGPTDDPSAVARGWITVPAAEHDFGRHRAILIVQHPDGGPMQIALDTEGVVGINRDGTRVHYTTTTRPGSSGAPCFSQDWQCVALHRGSQVTRGGRPARFNVGIPLSAIRRFTAVNGTDAAFAG